MKNVLLILTILISSYTFSSPPILINIDKELDSAGIIRMVEVVKIDSNKVHFKSLTNGLILTAFCPGKSTGESYRNSRIEKNYWRQDSNDLTEFLGGYWPKVGEQLLVIMNKKNEIRLFAKKENGKYRFWDPNITWYGSVFFYSSKFTSLKNCGLINGPNSCEDGCLINLEVLESNWMKK